MTTHSQNHSRDDTCRTGVHCANCCQLIPAGSAREIHTREIGDAVYYFCGPECYRRWQARGNVDSPPESNA